MSRTLFDLPHEEVAARPGAPTPRPYQSEAVDGGGGWAGLVPALAAGGRAMVEMATGTGKTVVMGLLADRHLRTRDTGVMMLAHREELIWQAKAELAPLIGFEPDVEMGENRADPRARCVLASVQTLFSPKRLSRFDPSRFGQLLVDECHHSVGSNATYARPLAHFKDADLVGVTATARRANEKRTGRPLALGPTFGTLAYSLGIREAVEGGWLVPVSQRAIRVDSLDIAAVESVDGDLAQGQLGRAMTHDKRTSFGIAAAVIEHCGRRPTLVFSCPRPRGEPVGQGEQLATAFNSLRPGSAVFLSGETPPDDRRRQLRRFEAGEFPYLIGCSLFTEGFNCPAIENIVMARLTESIVYYTQALGRGTRTLRGVLTPALNHLTPADRKAAIAASGKPRVTVYDFIGNSGRHKLITAADIFAGDAAGERVRAVREKSEGGPVDVLEMLEAEAKREAELATRRAVATVVTTTEEVDPFDYSDAGAGRKTAKRTLADPATDGQRAYIDKRGGVWRDGMTAGEAGRVISDIERRYKAKLCTQKQQRTLANLGFGDVAVPKAHAKALLDWADSLGWPEGMRRPPQGALGIRAVGGGFRLTIRGVPAGGVYATPGEVRAVYTGLAGDGQQR